MESITSRVLRPKRLPMMRFVSVNLEIPLVAGPGCPAITRKLAALYGPNCFEDHIPYAIGLQSQGRSLLLKCRSKVADAPSIITRVLHTSTPCTKYAGGGLIFSTYSWLSRAQNSTATYSQTVTTFLQPHPFYAPPPPCICKGKSAMVWTVCANMMRLLYTLSGLKSLLEICGDNDAREGRE